MNDVAIADAAVGTELTLLATENPLVILQDEAKFNAFYERVKAEVEGHVPDLTTATGRKAIASLAFKVTKTKTALDAARKQLTEDKRKEIAAVDAAGKKIRDSLDELAAEVRKPLTEWEAAEEARVQRCQATIARLRDMRGIMHGDTSEAVAARLAEVEAVEITEAEYGETFFDLAMDARKAAIEALTAGRDRILQEEADRAELERLRQEREEREAREAAERAERERAEAEAAEARRREEEAQAAAEAAERARAEAEARAAREAEEREAAAARAAEEAAARAAQEAEERVRREADEAAQAERQERERAHQAELEEERRQRQQEAQAREAAQAEAQRLADEQAARERAAAEQRAADEARARDVDHRSGIMRAAKEALMEHAELDEAMAKKVVLVIAAKSVPHISIAF